MQELFDFFHFQNGMFSLSALCNYILYPDRQEA